MIMTREIKKEKVSRLIDEFFNSATALDASIIKNQIYTELLTLPYSETHWIIVKYALENGSETIDKYLKLWQTNNSDNHYKRKAHETFVKFIDLVDLSFSEE